MSSGREVYCVGVTNESCENHVLRAFEFEATGDQDQTKSVKVAEKMMSFFRSIFGDQIEAFVGKVTDISSDSCPHQKRLNNDLIAEFARVLAPVRPIAVQPCSMHACSQGFEKKILQDTKTYTKYAVFFKTLLVVMRK